MLNYFDVENVVGWIVMDVRNMKLIVILREFVFWVVFSYELFGYKFKEKSFEEVCCFGKYFVEFGLYVKYLKCFYDVFDWE